MELVSKARFLYGFYRNFLLPVLCVLARKLAQHHFWMLNKVLIDAVSLRGLAEMNPFRLSQGCTISLLEEKNICHNTGVCVSHKRIVR